MWPITKADIFLSAILAISGITGLLVRQESHFPPCHVSQSLIFSAGCLVYGGHETAAPNSEGRSRLSVVPFRYDVLLAKGGFSLCFDKIGGRPNTEYIYFFL